MSLSYCARTGKTAVPPEWVRDLPHSRRAQRRLLEVGLWRATEHGMEPVLEERGIELARIKHTTYREGIPRELRDRILDRDRGICQLCGTPVDPEFHIDHIYPVSRGGATNAGNLQLAHPMCNIRKGARV